MNYGLNWEKELAERSETDWKFGAASLPSLVSIPLAEREKWLPQGEVQVGKEDFQDCATRSPLNKLAADFTYAYQNKLFKKETLVWLENNDYVRGGKIDFSDRFIAILSGTTRQGNSLKAPLDAIHNKGLIPKWMLPADPSMDWDTYHDPAKITSALLDLGARFAERFVINYEQVNETDFVTVLNETSVCAAGYAWPPPVNGEYPRTIGVPNHAFEIFKAKYYVFDNYYDVSDGDWIKKLAEDYDFVDYGYRVFVSKESVPTHLFLKNIGFQEMSPEVENLQRALLSLGYVIPHAVTNIYGSETKGAVWRFQLEHGIEGNDGMNVGPRTRYELNKALNPSKPFGGSLWTAVQAVFSGV